jgi:NAD(P)-dependent dehydrogenase (short-subunit alcohol dehydrogenase family)
MAIPSCWDSNDMGDLAGRTIVVTGASNGLGAAAASALASAGARVILAVRDTNKGTRAASTFNGATEVRQLDLADLDSVRQFAASWTGPLDVLINNAGIMAVPRGTTADGFECHIGTNHLGHFALTLLLLPHIRDRVVTLSSAMSGIGRVDVDDLNWERRRYGRWRAYGQSKLANLLFAFELDRRLSAAASTVRSIAAHPGISATGLLHTGARHWDTLLMPMRFVAQDAEHGALPTLFAATQDLPGASYIGPDTRSTTKRTPVIVMADRRAADPLLAARLWERSAELTGVGPALDLAAY